ncbi:MAG: MFS transporter [Desulfuromonadales bacterium]
MNHSTSSPVRVVLLLCATEILSMTGFATYPALLPLLQSEWQLTNSAAGLVSGTFFAGYMAAVPVLVSLTDRIDTRRIYLLATALACAGSLGFAFFASGLLSALAFQALVGAGLAGTYMPGLRILTDHFQGPYQSRGIAFYTASFGFGTTASLLLAGALAPLGWQWAFVVAAAGPLIAGPLVFFNFPAAAPRRAAFQPMAIFDFRPVLRNREAMGYILGYAAHCWELFGLRSWMPAFFAFSMGLTATSTSSLVNAAALAAWVNFLGPLASIFGNEAAVRCGRRRLILVAMAASGGLALLVGFSAPLPIAVVFTLVTIYFLMVMGDSAALTAGLVAAAAAERRGAAMALHSFLGFGAGFVAPLAFGAVLDLVGGNTRVTAWGLAFATLGAWCLIGSFISLLRRRRCPP